MFLFLMTFQLMATFFYLIGLSRMKLAVRKALSPTHRRLR